MRAICRRIIASRVVLFQLLSSVCHGLVETCEDLQAAFDLTKTQDVVVQIHPLVDIDCVDMTTMSMNSNTLTVESSEDMSSVSGYSSLNQIRFEVTGGAKLFWETNAKLSGPRNQQVDGGGIFVGEGSNFRFLNDLYMSDFGIQTLPDEGSDYASYLLSGGCVYTSGYFVVDGASTFTGCYVSGGVGGALYVGEQGSVLFNGGVDMFDMSIYGDTAGDGAGIYNDGKVNIKGDSRFESLYSTTGGAIYNAANAQFRFRSRATATFIDCTANDGTAGALYNRGYFKFSGPASFSSSTRPNIINSFDGRIVLSADSIFKDTYTTARPAISVNSRDVIVIPSSVTFPDSTTDCSRVYYRDTC